MKHSLFSFRTDFQCALELEEQLPQLRRLSGLLHREGFYEVGLNLPDLDLTKPEELKSLLNEHQVRVNMLATGVYAKTHGLSLSSGIPEERTRAVSGCKGDIDYITSMGCGIIISFLEGGPDNGCEVSERLSLESILELKPYIKEEKVQVLAETTNHKGASIIRTLKEGAHVTNFLDCPFIQLLADAYHMSIEESSLVDSLLKYMDYCPHLHISDDNRACPSLGSLDFTTIYRKLMRYGYKGTVTVEGNIQHGLLEDTRVCVAYLHEMCNGLHTLSHIPSHAV